MISRTVYCHRQLSAGFQYKSINKNVIIIYLSNKIRIIINWLRSSNKSINQFSNFQVILQNKTTNISKTYTKKNKLYLRQHATFTEDLILLPRCIATLIHCVTYVTYRSALRSVETAWILGWTYIFFKIKFKINKTNIYSLYC